MDKNKSLILFSLILFLVVVPFTFAFHDSFGSQSFTWQGYSSQGIVELQLSSEHVYSGSASLKVSYSNLESSLTIKPANPIQLAGIPLDGGLWLYGNQKLADCILSFIDAEGKNFSFHLGGAAPRQWQKLALSIEELNVSLPIWLCEIQIFPQEQSGTFFIDELNLFELTLKQNGWVFLEGEPVNLQLSCQYSGSPHELNLHAQLVGNGIEKDSAKEITISEDNSFHLNFGYLPQGRYELLLSGQKEKLTFSLPPTAITILAGKTEGLATKPYFGLQTHYALNRGLLPDNLQLASLAGADFIRDEILWTDVEPQQNRFTFPQKYDQFLAAASEMGLKTLLILDYGNPIYCQGAPTTPLELAAWRRYVTNVVQRYHGQVKHWEVWNEFNGGMGLTPEQRTWSVGEKAERYVAILKESYQAIKKIDPQATVIGCVNAGIDLPFIEEVINKGGLSYMDAISIHPYCYPKSPEEANLISKIDEVNQLIASSGGKQPLWITEIGWPTHDASWGISPQQQANYLARLYTLLRVYGKVEAVFWYDLQNDGPDSANAEHNFGIIDVDLSPKPAYLAYGTFARALQGTIATETLNLAPAVQCYRFQGQGKDNLVLWSTKSETIVSLPQLPERFSIRTTSGELIPQSSIDINNFQLGESPIIIECQSSTSSNPQRVSLLLARNPLRSGDSLEVKISSRKEIKKTIIQLFTLAGTQVARKEEQILGNPVYLSLDTGHLSKGVYIVQAEIFNTDDTREKARSLLLIL